MENWEQLYEKLTADFKPLKSEAEPLCCSNPHICHLNGCETCITCGTGNLQRCTFTVSPYEDNYRVKHHIPYKRLVYFKQKLGFLCGRYWFEENAKLLFLISNLKARSKRTSLPRIKKMLKRAGLNKYYRHIYTIYEAAYGEPLLALNSSTFGKMVYQFKQIERMFKHLKTQKKSMYSYNVILYFLLKLNHVPNYNKIVMPSNKSKLKRIVGDLVQELSGLCW